MVDNVFNSAVTIRLVELLKKEVTTDEAINIIVSETLESLNSFYKDIYDLEVDEKNNIIDILDKNINILKAINTAETKICCSSLLHIKYILLENIKKNRGTDNVQD